jgi:hypothetical protein
MTTPQMEQWTRLDWERNERFIADLLKCLRFFTDEAGMTDPQIRRLVRTTLAYCREHPFPRLPKVNP